MTAEHKELLLEFQEHAKSAGTATALMQHIAQRLHEKMARYNWVGFYLVDKADPNMLVMGPYVGSFTPNVCIPLQSGLCGAAATTRQTVVVDDVRKDPRYLQGSSMVISEIVVPIEVRGVVVGELDVESYFPSTFSEPEREFLETCARIVEKRLAKGV
jgi:L-methionine (R)-S-oxide reductase